MENTKRARKEKSRIQPSGGTYVEPKDLLSGLERVREAARRDSVQGSPIKGYVKRKNTSPCKKAQFLFA
jgi:hypothetical protein